MRRVTVEQIRLALQACGGNRAKAARVLGMARNNLYKRMASNGIGPDEYRGNTATPAGVSGDAHAVSGARGAGQQKSTSGTGSTAHDPVSSNAILAADS